jgi:hypothetical protein
LAGKDSVIHNLPLSTAQRTQLDGHVKLMCKDVVDIAHTVNANPPNDCQTFKTIRPQAKNLLMMFMGFALALTLLSYGLTLLETNPHIDIPIDPSVATDYPVVAGDDPCANKLPVKSSAEVHVAAITRAPAINPALAAHAPVA